MKNLFNSILCFAATLAATISLPASAANWNDYYGIGSQDGYFSASGVPLSVIGSVRSNTLYVIEGGPKSYGSPNYQKIAIKPDLTGCTLDFWTATNSWTCASNQPAGTNTIWLTSTNSGLATNDVLVLQGSDGTSQLLVLSGNATDSSGLVYTNSSGYCGIKVFNTPTNTISAGDKLYKMAQRRSLTPLTIQNVTNDLSAPWGTWWGVNTRAFAFGFNGTLDSPSAITMTFSNSAGLSIDGFFKRREQ